MQHRAYAEEAAEAQGGSAGHRQAVRWIRRQAPADVGADRARTLQEPYSLRCVPQIAGAVLDFLEATGSILGRAAPRDQLLAPDPGATSGLAGVQRAATAMLAEIRQRLPRRCASAARLRTRADDG